MRRLPAALVALSIALVACATARADSVSFSRKPSETRYRVGAVTVVEHYEYRGGPRWSVEVRRRWRTLGRFEDTAFGELYADPAHGYFVGVSNLGIPDTSVIVFDAQGNLVMDRGHSGWAMYCDESVSVLRRWLGEPAAATFEYVTTADGETQLRDITLTGCDGERFSLDAAGGGELAALLAQHRKAPSVAARAAKEREARAAACAESAGCAHAEARFSVPGVVVEPVNAAGHADDEDDEDA
jgi:hypothetical protein